MILKLLKVFDKVIPLARNSELISTLIDRLLEKNNEMHKKHAISFQFVIILLTMFTQSDYYDRRKVLNGDTFCDQWTHANTGRCTCVAVVFYILRGCN